MEEFFFEHMFNMNDLKIVTDKKKMSERCEALMHFMNKAPFQTALPKLTAAEKKKLTFQERLMHDLHQVPKPKRARYDSSVPNCPSVTTHANVPGFGTDNAGYDPRLEPDYCPSDYCPSDTDNGP